VVGQQKKKGNYIINFKLEAQDGCDERCFDSENTE
jgi:hypothetical protein